MPLTLQKPDSAIADEKNALFADRPRIVPLQKIALPTKIALV